MPRREGGRCLVLLKARPRWRGGGGRSRTEILLRRQRGRLSIWSKSTEGRHDQLQIPRKSLLTWRNFKNNNKIANLIVKCSPLALHELDGRRKGEMRREPAPPELCFRAFPECGGCGETGRGLRSKRSGAARSPASISGRAVCGAQSPWISAIYQDVHILSRWNNLCPKWQCCQGPVRFVTCGWREVWSPEVMLE